MNRFITRYRDRIIGVLSGFDRLVFRGTLRQLAFASGMMGFLWKRKILLKDFVAWAKGVTTQVQESALEAARVMDRPIQYLPSSRTDKEAVALAIAQRDQIKEGLVAVLTCVEPCRTFEIHRNRAQKRLQLVSRESKCKFIYQYMIDPEVGWMHARIQTWLPFNVQVCINGREWLSRQMDREGIAYTRADNSFPLIANLERAQELMKQQVKTRWPEFLRRMARRLNPDHGALFPELDLDYYWSIYQSEWATDVMFKDRQSLMEIYPGLIRHGITAFSCADVMRFLGRKLDGRFNGEIVSSLKERVEGIRIKHWVDENSEKLYDKWSSLRVENTMQNPRPFKVYRAKEGEPMGEKEWRGLRKGIADVARRAQLQQAANNRYLDAMAAADTSTPLGKLAGEITGRVSWHGTRIRGLRPWDPDDVALFRIVNDGKWTIHGFRNRDLQAQLFKTPPESDQEQRRRSSRVTRLIGLLRAHRLIKKEPGAHRYTVTPRGREILTAILAAQDVSLEELRKAAA